jgi:ATP-binding cassette, subfamily B, multidrug efflux pump
MIEKSPDLKPMSAKQAFVIVQRIVRILLKDHLGHLLIAGSGLIYIIIVQASNALFVRRLVDHYIVPNIGSSTVDTAPLIRLSLTMAILFITGAITFYLVQRTMARISQRIIKNFRDSLFSHTQRLPITYFDTHQSGAIMSLYTNDIQMLHQFVYQGLGLVFGALINISIISITMISISPILAVVQILSTFILAPLVIKITKRSVGYFRAQQAAVGELGGYIEELLDGQKVVKVFDYEQRAIVDFDQLGDNLHMHATKALRNGNLIWPILGNYGYLQYLGMAVLGSMLSIMGIGGLSVGSIIAFLQLSRTFTFPTAEIFIQLNSMMMAIAGAERLFAVLEQPLESDEGTVSLEAVHVNAAGDILPATGDNEHHWAWRSSTGYIPLGGAISFNNLTFSYKPGVPTLKGIQLSIAAGQSVALVGATGAGKTTISNLLSRFYEVDSGEILYDGIHIKDIKKADLRRSMGLVLQETRLFSGSIAQNIGYGVPGATQERIEEAAMRAGAHHFISQLADKYQTQISDESDALAAGERQLLAIARAELLDPPVMILDEATSAIDSQTEATVQAGMSQLMHGRTVFIIAHRLSTIRNADLIVVMDDGHIAEAGNHAQLLQQKGIYAKLVEHTLEVAPT